MLYKYLHKHGLRFLSNLKLKLTSPADVDDPFEMIPRPGASVVTEDMVDRLLAHPDRMKEFFALSGWENLAEWTARCRANPEEFRAWLGRKMPEGIGQYCRQAAEAISRDFLMLCFSKSYDNVLMWSHYGDNHRGIAVGFDGDGLESALSARALEVDCQEERTTFDVEQLLFPELQYAEQLMTRKSPSWKYQEEVRYVVRRGSSSFFECPPNLVQTVLLGCKFPPAQIACVRKLMAKNGIRAELLIGLPDENLFKINFLPVLT